MQLPTGTSSLLKKKTKTKDINKGVHLKKKEAPKNLIDTGVY